MSRTAVLSTHFYILTFCELLLSTFSSGSPQLYLQALNFFKDYLNVTFLANIAPET